MTATSQTKHTPGPWSLKSRNNPHEWDVVKFDTPSSDDPWFVAAVFDGAEGRASLDNARLIAAAPDLVAALRALTEFTERQTATWPDQPQSLRSARTALAKAGA
jgi:hypothetical protein